MLDDLLDFDKKHIMHPYSSVKFAKKKVFVESASGVRLKLADGSTLIDGMSSWWSAIHGYNVPELNEAVCKQLSSMSHVMFGGLTHKPAIDLAKILLEITDDSLEHIFFCDSGSVSVEVAIKMAFQYHKGRGESKKTKLLSFEKGYHGDTFGAMSVCDPQTGMHSIFGNIVHKNIFAKSPECGFYEEWDDSYIEDFKSLLEENHKEIAAVIIEPIVQGAGGMRIYSPEFLKRLKTICSNYDVLIIFDEIATGFGRTGKLFAYEHAGVVPDILCIGKALTGGYLSMAGTLCSKKVIDGIEADGNILMHGPTFMANPLACSVANASVELLLKSNWQERVQNIENILNTNLKRCEELELVKEVRILGAIGVVELEKSVDLEWMTARFLERGVWIRPFLNLVYIMPPFIIERDELLHLIDSIYEVILEFKDR